MNPEIQTLASLLADPVRYTRATCGIALRPYQCAPIPRILDSIQNHRGDTILLCFSRQSGKDEFITRFNVWLLDLFSSVPASILEVNPTYVQQTTRAMLRMDQALDNNPLTRGRWSKRGQFIRLLDQASLTFLSADSSSSVVGATASLLLIVNEAQDLDPDSYRRKFLPMTASTNATRLLAGTAWHSTTLLSQELRVARNLQEQDGRQRVFMFNADDVRAVLPLYGQHVDAEIARMGRDHPLIMTQYFNEELDSQLGLFSPARFARMHADQPRQDSPHEGHLYAFLLDVAGQDEALMADPVAAIANPGRDFVALSIVDVDRSTIAAAAGPTFRVVNRFSWQGENHLAIHSHLQSLCGLWNPQYIVMDATGVGEGLRALLDRDFHHRLIAVKYNPQVKSSIGYGFINLINTNRFKDCAPQPRVEAQYHNCQASVQTGPGHLMSWGVPNGKRGPDGKLIHDDFLMADSLAAILDSIPWYEPVSTTFTPPPPPYPYYEVDRQARLRAFGSDYLDDIY